MSADEGASRRVGGAIASQDPLLARDVIAAVRAYLARWDLDAWDAPHNLDPGTEEIPRIERLQKLGAALTLEVGDERAEDTTVFFIRTPVADYSRSSEADAREAIRKYVQFHGEEATRRNVAVYLRIEATGTSHALDVDRFLDP